MSAPTTSRTPVSIVCVFNDPEVLEQCLARSIAAGLSGAPDTEFLPVDNRGGAFSTAGAALNHGAGLAHNPVIVFVHQDVVLHSLEELERAAHILEGDAATIGVPDQLYGEEVAAFIVLKQGREATAEDIGSFCRERLADYKCPKTVRIVKDIPKGPTGKLLKRELARQFPDLK